MASPTLQQLIDRLEPSLRKVFLSSISDIKDSIQMAQVVEALEKGDMVRLQQVLHLTPEFLMPLDRALHEAYYEAGAFGVATLPPLPDAYGVGYVVVRFDGRNPRAERWLADQSARLVRGINQETMVSLQMVLRDGMERGLNPKSVALNIVGRMNKASGKREGGIIGLSASQTQSAVRARNELENLNPDYFSRKRRDARYDSKVRKAIRSGKKLSKSEIDKIVGRYETSLLKLRADTIARTEMMAGLNEAKWEGMQQLIESGHLKGSQVTKVWDATMDTRTRDSHLALDGQEAKLRTPFVSPLTGAQMQYPHDHSLGAPAGETIQCRCYLDFKVDFG